ncbi:unnamed protein product [Phytophthora fragariaefolia]|uniref:Unnamed protein product n=1 Tax=Phytophthora fragariaefolia TaxID=1490495 RepID=A0A9W6XDV0_9STRA|nr:unnamed protein product [Phytophthora fragariaefolia]
MFSIRTELKNLKYTIEDLGMVEVMLESLPYQSEFESLIMEQIQVCTHQVVTTEKLVCRASQKASHEGGSEDHLKGNCLDNDTRLSGDISAERKRKPSSNVKIRHSGDEPSHVRSEEDSGAVAEVVTGQPSHDAAGDGHELPMDDIVVDEQQVASGLA